MTARGAKQADWGYEHEGESLADLVRALWESGLPVTAIWRRVQEVLYDLPADYHGARMITPAAIEHLVRNRGFTRKSWAMLRPGVSPTAELVIEAEKALVTNDWHVPYYNRELFKRLLQLAASERPEVLIISGDFLDAEAFSALPLYKRPEGLKDELNQARDIIDACLEVIPQVALCVGNHEARFVRAIRGELNTKDFAEVLIAPLAEPRRVLVTGRGYVILRAKRDGEVCGTWRVTHPLSYSRVAPQVERQIAGKTGQHVLGSHGHLFALGVDTSGRRVSGQIGGMIDPGLVPYLIFDTTHPTWVPGFWYLRRGTIYPMTLLQELTDWDLFSGR